MKKCWNLNGRILLWLMRQLAASAARFLQLSAFISAAGSESTPSHQVQAFMSWSAAGTQKLIKFWKEQCKHLQVQWSCEHGHGGECTACTKRTAQASKVTKIKRTIQISSGTIVMWEGGACMTKKYRHDIVYTVRIKEWDIWGIQYHIWGCRKKCIARPGVSRIVHVWLARLGTCSLTSLALFDT